jgi:hypothetical protein
MYRSVATIDFARVEVAGVLRKRGLLAGRLTPEEFAGAVRVIDDIGVTVYETTADRQRVPWDPNPARDADTLRDSCWRRSRSDGPDRSFNIPGPAN